MSQYKLSLLIEAQNRATAEIEGLKKQIDGLKNQAGPAQKSMDGFLGSIKGVGGGMALLTGGAAIGAVMAIKDIGLAAIATAGKFEKYEKILGNAMQSQRLATDAMSMLKEVSTQTPFELDKLTESYIKLVNRGFTPTKKEIISLGDLASSQGKQFDQLVEAMLDAQTGEFERLKEFGVRASAQGDKVSFTFKGVTQTVDKTDEAIKKYILSLGNLGGVQGSMITQSDTYEGRLSNLSDAWTNLSATMGEYFLPMAKSSISAMTDIVNGINTNIQELSKWSQSTNENIVFIADIFEYLANLAGPIINFGKSFGISMQQVINSAVNAINPLSGLQNALQNVLSLAGINVDLSIGGIMDKAKNALGSKTKAIVNAQNEIIKKNSFVANPALLGFDKLNQNLAKEMGKLEGVKKIPPKFTGSGGGGGGKKVDAEKQNQVKAEQELIKETQKRIEQVEKLKVTELEKAQMIVKINDDMANKLKVIRGNDQKDAQTRFQSIAEKAKEQVSRMQDKFKDLYGAVKDSIGKSVDEIKRLDDQIKSGVDKINDLKNSISELNKDTQQSLTDRYVEVNKEMADTKEKMAQWGVDANEMIKLQEKMAGLQKESAFIAGKVSETDLNKAIEFDKLTPAEKLVAKAEEKKKELEIEIKAQEDKLKTLEEAKNKEVQILANLNATKTTMEQSYTKFFKEELQSRQDAYASYISAIKSLASSAPDGVSSVVSGAMGMNIQPRANGGNVQPGQTYLVGENGPELFTTKYTGQIVPNNSGGSQGNVSINFNGVTISNGMDLQNFKGEVEKVVVKAMRNMRAGIY